MKFQLDLTRRAERDIDSIVGWLHQRSPKGAQTWLNRLGEVLEALRGKAANCPLAPEDGLDETEIRELIFKTRRGRPYRLLFSIVEEVVVVRHVREQRLGSGLRFSVFAGIKLLPRIELCSGEN